MKKDPRYTPKEAGNGVSPPIDAAAFKAEVRAWAVRLEVAPAAVHLSRMRRKWASCSNKGRVTFDRGLLSEAAAFRREAIVHELLHLKVRNHGPLFRALLLAALADRAPGKDSMNAGGGHATPLAQM